MPLFLKAPRFFSTFLLLFILFSKSAGAAPLSPDQVPEDLKPWISWVLHGHEEKRCPFFQGNENERRCDWPGALSLNLRKAGGDFQITWTVYAKAFVPLPGDEKHWPQQVKANGQAIPVTFSEDQPRILLNPGSYTITGTFQWEELPESLPVPPEVGLMGLNVEGQTISFPQRDEDGLVWIQKTEAGEKEENRLEIRVHRKLLDDIPFQVLTQLTVDVSGKSQEVILPHVLLKDFIPMSLDSGLPARLDANGDLRVQARPGTWTIEILGRAPQAVQALTLEEHPAPWPNEEVWVFQAFPDLRSVSLEGVPSIDPQQTTLPDDWKRLPAYRLQAGNTLRLVEKQRGNANPPADQLNLFREWWLDFDGNGLTVRDEITGSLHRSWRLEMNPATQLGRVSVDGKDQLITQLPGDKRIGVEIRQGRLSLGADSRIPDRKLNIPAVSWDQTFQRVSGELNLPPGWRLFAVSGADHVPQTWVNQWSLLELFLVLITMLAFWKLWGWKWGLVSLFALGLTFPERDSPQWIWLAVLAGVALLRLIPKGKIFTLLRLYRVGALLVLIGFCVPFMVHQVRIGIYPSLEHPYQSMEGQSVEEAYQRKIGTRNFEAPQAEANQMDSSFGKGGMNVMPTAAPPPAPVGAKGEFRQAKLDEGSSMMKVKRRTYDQSVQMNLQEHRPGTKVQTGPGLPGWTWNKFSIGWSGPVSAGQTIGLYLIPPFANVILALLRVALLVAMLICVLGFGGDIWRRLFRGRLWTTTALVLLSLGVLTTQARAADYPSQELLDQLRDKLLENPLCVPNCAAISRLNIEGAAQSLRLRMEIQVEADTAVPVPGGMKDWLPTSANVDGKESAGFFLDGEGQAWMQLFPGVHQVILEGPLPDRDTVSISLPLKPYYTESILTGWVLQGLHENGEVDDNLQLNRSQGMSETQPSLGGGSTGALPPFVIVERRFILGLTWEIQSTVRRVTPVGSPVVLDIPLIAGESVTTEGMRVDQNKIQISMAPGSDSVEWRSVLEERRAINLKAPENSAYLENWLLEVSPIWHVEFKGIPTIHPADSDGAWLPEWRPWPGEAVAIQVSRPEGVKGQTMTIDQSVLQVTPGLRFTDSQLNFTLRSSLGGQHTLRLPPGSQLQSVSINAQTQPIRPDGDKVTLPVVPGTQRVELKWQENRGIRNFFRTSAVELGLPSVNTEVRVSLSNNRWVLYTGGPRMGPAVLFWSMLLVLLIFAFGLSRTGITPLGTLGWLLLGVGISQFPGIPTVAGILVAGWFLLMGWRGHQTEWGKFKFDLRQIFLVFYSILFLIVLFASIYQGLLGNPEMQIAGNGSSPTLLRWFQDRSPTVLPQPYVLSLPDLYYRLAMLAWALWIAWSLIKWLKWGWRCFAAGGLWRELRKITGSMPPNATP